MSKESLKRSLLALLVVSGAILANGRCIAAAEDEPAPKQKLSYVLDAKDLSNALQDERYFQSLFRTTPFYKDGKVEGLRVFGINPESIFEKAGLKNGDILLAANKEKIQDWSQLMPIFQKLEKNKKLRLRINRDNEIIYLFESTK